MTSERAPVGMLLEMLDGYRAVQVLYVAAELGVADHLADGPKRSAELAQALGAHAPSLQRLLRALASLDLLAEHDDDSFGLTPVGELLRSDVPGSLRAAALYFGGRRHWTAWGQLLDSVRSGSPVGGGSPTVFAEMAARAPAAARTFNEAMAALSAPVNAAVTDAYDFSGIGTLIDVGGGYGALLGAVLLANPRLRGVLFEIPAVVDVARTRIDAAGLAERCQVVAGDAFASVPAGGDAYLLKWVLHDWNDELCLAILRNCRAAMGEHARLLVVERVLPRRAQPTLDTTNKFLSDLNMLLLSGGCERTEEEYRALLGAAGLSLERIVPTATPHAIIEAVPG